MRLSKMRFKLKLGFTEFKIEFGRTQYYDLVLIAFESLYWKIKIQLKANDNIECAFQK